MTRQNVTDGPREILTVSCPTCTGDGVIVSPETHAVEIERRLRRHVAGSKAEAFLVELHSEVAKILAGPDGTHLEELEKETGRRFAFKTKKSFRLDRFQVLSEGKASEIDGLGPKPEERSKARAKRGGRAPAAVALEDAVLEDEPAELAPSEDGPEPVEEKPKKKTRRGTRGGRGRKKKTATPAAASTDGAEAAASSQPEPEPEPEPEQAAAAAAAEPGGNGDAPAAEKPKKKTRRGTRGGRRRRKKPAAESESAANGEDGQSGDEPIAAAEEAG
jgi:hypothetical protein